MLARRLTTILPAMSLAEALETTRIHRVAGLTGERTAVVTTRPFRAPHHTISDVGLLGGGQVPMPGEVSLAHNGALFPEVIGVAFGILYHPTHVGRLLKALRWSPQKSMRRACQRDEAAIARWRTETWPTLWNASQPMPRNRILARASGPS